MNCEGVTFAMEGAAPTLRAPHGAGAGGLAELLGGLRQGGIAGPFIVRLSGELSGSVDELHREIERLREAEIPLHAVALGDLQGTAAEVADRADACRMAEGATVRVGARTAGFAPRDAGMSAAPLRRFPPGETVTAAQAIAHGLAEAWPLPGSPAKAEQEAVDALFVPEWREVFKGGRVSKADLARHALVLGEPGSGKSASVIAPLIRAAMREDAPVSCLLVIDPKDEHGPLMPNAVTLDTGDTGRLPAVRIDARAAEGHLAEGRVLEGAKRLLLAGSDLMPAVPTAKTLAGDDIESGAHRYWDAEGARLAQVIVAATLSLLPRLEDLCPDLTTTLLWLRDGDGPLGGWSQLQSLRTVLLEAGHVPGAKLLDAVDPARFPLGSANADADVKREGPAVEQCQALWRRLTKVLRQALPREALPALRRTEVRMEWLYNAVVRDIECVELLGDAAKSEGDAEDQETQWRVEATQVLHGSKVAGTDTFAVGIAELCRSLLPMRTRCPDNALSIASTMLADLFSPVDRKLPIAGLLLDAPSFVWERLAWDLPLTPARMTEEEKRWRRDVLGMYAALANSGQKGESGHYIGLLGSARGCLVPFQDVAQRVTFGVEPGWRENGGLLDFHAAASAGKDGAPKALRMIGGLRAGGDAIYARAVKASYFVALMESEVRRERGATMPLALYIADEFHRVVTTGAQHGEDTFLDVCRARGVACVLATQSVAGLQVAIGDGRPIRSQVILSLTATKWFFRTSDHATLGALDVLSVRNELAAAKLRPASRLGCGECHVGLPDGRTVCRMVQLTPKARPEADARPRLRLVVGDDWPVAEPEAADDWLNDPDINRTLLMARGDTHA